MSDGPHDRITPLVGLTPAVILGGRWDGHEVEFQGERVEFKRQFYVALHNGDSRVYYLLESLVQTWFSVGR